MHGSSLKNMKRFIDKYLQGIVPGKVLDVGSQDVNGTYKPLFAGWDYRGLDVSSGNNVDIVVKDDYHWDMIFTNTFDVVISGQAFEHMESPWLAITEIARVLKPGGLCCIIAPSSGPIHFVPGGKDCYRYYPDGLTALARYANLDCIEAYVGWQSIANFEDDQWKDAVLICRKPTAKITNMPPDVERVWQKAQELEAGYWRVIARGVTNSYFDEQLQHMYAEKMGIIIDQWSRIDLKQRSILDVGGGPVSLLLKTYNYGRRKVIDPLDVPFWVIDRYREAGVELERRAAEDMDEHGWGEVWIYNVLQHTCDPEKVITKARRAGKVLRIFEYLSVPVEEMHPHLLTKEKLDEWLGGKGVLCHVDRPIVGEAYYGVFPQSQQEGA